MEIGRDEVARLVAQAIAGRRCISGWLGYAEVLFLSFGDHVVVAGEDTATRPAPACELESAHADWAITGEPKARSGDPDVPATERVVEGLIGTKVLEASLGEDGRTLRLVFETGQALEVCPWTPDGEEADAAWSLALPGPRVLAMACDGRAELRDRGEPVTNWFVS